MQAGPFSKSDSDQPLYKNRDHLGYPYKALLGPRLFDGSNLN